MSDARFPVRVGIIGFGQIGRTHLEALSAFPDATVVAVSRREPVSNDLGIAWHADFRELVGRDDIDLVAICTPSGHHAEQALAALDAGKGVVIEKPIALMLEDGERVVRTARDRKLFLSVISQRRTEDAVRSLYSALADGRLGQPVLGEALVRWSRDQRYYDSADWRGTRAMDGGVLMNQAIHAIDLLCWLLGPVESVSGATATLVRQIEAEDAACASLRFASGALGAITATTAIAPGLPAEINLFCERGLVSLHDANVARWEVPGSLRRCSTICRAAAAPTRRRSAAWDTAVSGGIFSTLSKNSAIPWLPARMGWRRWRRFWPLRNQVELGARCVLVSCNLQRAERKDDDPIRIGWTPASASRIS